MPTIVLRHASDVVEEISSCIERAIESWAVVPYEENSQ